LKSLIFILRSRNGANVAVERNRFKAKNRGTDHRHANVMFVLGGKVKGGKVYGRWPGLEPEVLYEGRDLALTTDFRGVCGEVLSRHMGQKDLSNVFPDYQFPSRPLGLLT